MHALLTRLGMHALLTRLGMLFKGVSTRFGLRIVENCVENTLGRTVCSAFQNLRLGSIASRKQYLDGLWMRVLYPTTSRNRNAGGNVTARWLRCDLAGRSTSTQRVFAGRRSARCVDKASLGPLGKPDIDPQPAFPPGWNWPVRVGLGLAGKIAVAISDPTWPLETCLRYPS